MCAHLLLPAAGAAAGWLCRAVGARLRADARAATSARPEVGAATTSALTLAGDRRHRWLLTVLLCVVDSQGLLPAAGHRPAPGHHRRPPPDISFTAHDRAPAARSPTRCCTIPTSRRVASFIGADGTNATTNSGRLSISARSRASERSADAPARSSPRLEPQVSRRRGHHALPAAGAGPPDRQPRQPHAVPVHPRGRRPRRARDLGAARCVDEAALAARAPRRGQRPADRRAPGDRSPSTATPPRASGVTPQAIDDTLYDAFGQRQVSTIFTQLNQYRVILEVKPEFQQDPGAPRPASTSAPDRRARCRSRPSAQLAIETTAPLADQPPGPVPRGHHLLQPGAPASRSATPSQAIRSGRAADRPARQHPAPSFQGTAQAFRELAGERAAPDPGRAGHRLHRAGRALRELHPPHHDPLDLALGRRRRPARPDAAAQRLQRHRPHRHHPAHRHREEERHHDDRLRARGRARAGASRRAKPSTRPACCASGPS